MNKSKAQKIPIGKSIRLRSRTRTYNALVVGNNADELRLITENGALSKPSYRNYGKTWSVEKVN